MNNVVIHANHFLHHGTPSINTPFVMASSASGVTSLEMPPSGDLRQRGAPGPGGVGGTSSRGGVPPDTPPSGAILPFYRRQATFVRELRSVLVEPQAARVLGIGVAVVACALCTSILCHHTNSLALMAYNYLAVFDLLMLGCFLLDIWIQKQQPTQLFTFGYERYQVLAVFASTMLAMIGSLFILKDCVERLLDPPPVSANNLTVGTCLAFSAHLVAIYGVRNKAFAQVMEAAGSSWLQEHMADMSQSICRAVPALSALLLPRVNPFALLAGAGAAALLLLNTAQESSMSAADSVAAAVVVAAVLGTMYPMAACTGRILLQTTPPHMVGQLDKCLHEAATVDGVLEIRHDHFWTLALGTLAGTLHVRVRRDANEQLVLAHVCDRLQGLAQVLTVQVVKEDLSAATSYSLSATAAGPPTSAASLRPATGGGDHSGAVGPQAGAQRASSVAHLATKGQWANSPLASNLSQTGSIGGPVGSAGAQMRTSLSNASSDDSITYLRTPIAPQVGSGVSRGGPPVRQIGPPGSRFASPMAQGGVGGWRAQLQAHQQQMVAPPAQTTGQARTIPSVGAPARPRYGLPRPSYQ